MAAQANMLRATKPGSSKRLVKATIPLFRAGRNQTCPCGSGKKFKHCCINKAITNVEA